MLHGIAKLGRRHVGAHAARASSAAAATEPVAAGRPSTFTCPERARDHEAFYASLGVPLWQVVRRGFLFEGEDLRRLKDEIQVEQFKGDTFEAHHVCMETRNHPFYYDRLQQKFHDIFGEPLLIGGMMRMDMFNMRWSRALMEPNAPIGYVHEDGDDLEMCADLELPPDLAAPELSDSGWRWDECGTAVALLIGLRVCGESHVCHTHSTRASLRRRRRRRDRGAAIGLRARPFLRIQSGRRPRRAGSAGERA